MKQSNYYYAVTINNLEVVSGMSKIDDVYDYFMKHYDYTIYTISVERNEINNNTHYHLLIGSEIEVKSFDVYNIHCWSDLLKESHDVTQYDLYIKKDGKYKIFNPHGFENKKSWYDLALELCISKMPLREMFQKYPHLIKHINKIRVLHEYYNPLIIM